MVDEPESEQSDSERLRLAQPDIPNLSDTGDVEIVIPPLKQPEPEKPIAIPVPVPPFKFRLSIENAKLLADTIQEEVATGKWNGTWIIVRNTD